MRATAIRAVEELLWRGDLRLMPRHAHLLALSAGESPVPRCRGLEGKPGDAFNVLALFRPRPSE